MEDQGTAGYKSGKSVYKKMLTNAHDGRILCALILEVFNDAEK
jgi:hypothetical protein